MRNCLRQYLLLFSVVLISLMIDPQILLAQTHVVSPADIHQELVNASQTRQRDLEKTKQMFSSEAGQRALKSAHISPAQVEAAISTLSDAELARLAARASSAENDFAGGKLSERDLLFILIGIAVVILIIVAVN
jgi:hypothetical protein